MGTEVFQTYDGELKFVGSKKLLWHKLAMNPQKLQSRGDALTNSNLPAECKEWLERAVNVLSVEWQYNLADIAQNHVGSIRTVKVTSLHDYLVLYSEVVDKVQTHTLSDGMTVLCDLAAKSNGSTPNSPAQRSSYNHSSSSNNISQHQASISEPYTAQQASTLQNLIQAHWKLYRKYFAKLSDVRGKYFNSLEKQVGSGVANASTERVEVEVESRSLKEVQSSEVLKVNSSSSQPDVKSVVEKQIKTAKTKRSKTSPVATEYLSPTQH
eukprot:gene35098-43273_t